MADDALIGTIRSAVIGDDEAIATPFGVRRVTYADYTASARSLSFIEDFIRETVLPLYANTHTESSGTGMQTTRFREDARRIVREACGANEREHAVTPSPGPGEAPLDVGQDFEHLRWFWLREEITTRA